MRSEEVLQTLENLDFFDYITVSGYEVLKVPEGYIFTKKFNDRVSSVFVPRTWQKECSNYINSIC